MRKNEESLREMWDIKCTNIFVMRVPGEDRKEQTKSIQEIMVKPSQIYQKNKIQAQLQQTSQQKQYRPKESGITHSKCSKENLPTKNLISSKAIFQN